MATVSQILSQKRKERDINLEIVSNDLHIKKENLEALEKADWKSLPDPAFVQGFIKSYSQYLDLDPKYMLALYRREYDPKKHPQSTSVFKKRQTFFLTPARLAGIIFVLIVIVFISYLFFQYTSILSSPKLVVNNPQDNQTTTVPVTLISGKTEKSATVSVNGDFIPVDQDGNFTKELKLTEGQNTIEIIAARRLSPKTKVTRIIRLSP
jgi:cytoskeletal protein RodZ